MKGKIKMIKLKVKSKEHVSLYLFGSAVYTENPSDIDIAIIYEKDKIGIEEIMEFRKTLEMNLFEQTKCQIDSILLTKDEEVEMNFLENAKHFLI